MFPPLLLPLLLLLLPTAQPSHYVVHISDVHGDDLYTATGTPDTFCHGDAGAPEQWYGQRGCGLPWRTAQLALDALRQRHPTPSAVVWTGDTAPHWPYTSWDQVFPKLHRVTQMLQSSFPGAQVIPAIGNHDAYPSDQFPADNTTFYQHYLRESGWSDLLPPQAANTFSRGGYYRLDVDSTRYLVLNTPLYYHRNNMTDDSGADPSGQLDWLQQQLRDSSNLTTVVVGHIAPGYAYWSTEETQLKKPYNDRLVQILCGGTSRRRTHVFGHEHIDTLKFCGDGEEQQQTGSFFLAPSLFPGVRIQNVNPSLRVMLFNNLGELDDIYQYHIDLKAANEAHRADPSTDHVEEFWRTTYNFRERYGLQDLTDKSIQKLLETMKSNASALHRYWMVTNGGADTQDCEPSCQRQHICVVTAFDTTEMNQCLNAADHPGHSWMLLLLTAAIARLAA